MIKINHMQEVAEILGVELEREFKIKGFPDSCRYLLTNEGLMWYNEAHTWWEDAPDVLSRLLAGEIKAVTPSWRPAQYHDYYYACLDYDNLWGYATWTNTKEDKSRFKHGIIFKTREEAINMSKKMLLAISQEKSK